MLLGSTISAGEHGFNRFVVLWGVAFAAFLTLAIRELKEVRRNRTESGLRAGLTAACKALNGEMAVDRFTAEFDGTPFLVKAHNLEKGIAELVFDIPESARHLSGLRSENLSNLRHWVSSSLAKMAGKRPSMSLTVSNSQVAIQFVLSARRSASQIPVVLRSAFEALSMLETAPDWLLTAAETDMLQQSTQALAVLGKHFPDSAETKARLEKALTSTNPALRYVAARHLGAAGDSVLRELALLKTPLTRTASLEQLAPSRALSELIQRKQDGRIDDVRKTLHRAVIKEPLRSRIALRALEGITDAECLNALRAVIQHGYPAVLPDVARCLLPFGEGAQFALLEVLDKCDKASSELALGGLARFGTIDAVEPLVAFKKKSEKLGLDLEHATDATIWSIQDKMGPVEGGRLTVADEADGGALSVSVQEGGLAIKEDEAESKLELGEVAEEVETQ